MKCQTKIQKKRIKIEGQESDFENRGKKVHLSKT